MGIRFSQVKGILQVRLGLVVGSEAEGIVEGRMLEVKEE